MLRFFHSRLSKDIRQLDAVSTERLRLISSSLGVPKKPVVGGKPEGNLKSMADVEAYLKDNQQLWACFQNLFLASELAQGSDELNFNHFEIPLFTKAGRDPAAIMMIAPNPPGSGPLNSMRLFRKRPKKYPFWEGGEVLAEIGADGRLTDPATWDHGDADNEVGFDCLEGLGLPVKAVVNSASTFVSSLTSKIYERNKQLHN